jgi:adenylate cyclase
MVSAEHEGEIVKLMGDAVMLRCCDPGASIRLALRLVSEVEDDPALPPIRIGVHSGPAVSHEGDWYGRAVNVAARLCSVAAGGEVLVSECTLTSAGELPRVAVGERRLHWLKNVTEPVAARTAELRRAPGRVWRFMSLCPLLPDRHGQATVGGAA